MPLSPPRPRGRSVLSFALVGALAFPLLAGSPAWAADVAGTGSGAAATSTGPAPETTVQTPATAPAGSTVVGTLVQAHVDPGPGAGDPLVAHGEHADHDAEEGDGHDADVLSWVQTGTSAVRVPTEDVADVDPGATVAVTLGGTAQDAATEDGLAPAREVLAARTVAAPVVAAPSAAPVNHGVTVVMLQPAGSQAQRAADPTTLADVVAAVNGPVASFWSEQTGGAARFGVVAARDWTTTTATCADPWALWSAAAAVAGWQQAPDQHLLVYVPAGSAGCSYGLGTIGWSMDTGGLAYVQNADLMPIGHELGHNMTLGHSSEFQCDGTVSSGTCETFPYLDLYDVMGYAWGGPTGSLNLAQAALLGVLPAGAVQDVPPSGGSYVLAALDARSTTTLWGLRITDSTGAVWWLEYRSASTGGRDSWLSGPANTFGLDAGVLLHRSVDDGDATSLLLDGSPSPQSSWDSDYQTALPVGRSIPLAGGAYTVTVRSVGTTAAVTVTPSSLPDAPTGVSAVAGDGSATVSWRAAVDNGSPVIGYTVTASPGGTVATTTGATSVRMAGLTNGTAYTFSVTATSALGTGPAGTSSAVVPALHPVDAAWQAWGGPAGRLGTPVGMLTCGLRDGGCSRDYVNGSVYWSPATGAQAVDGEIYDRWKALGRQDGRYGYPVAGARCGLAGGGCLQEFQGGAVYWAPGRGAHAVDGEIRARWGTLGWEYGRYGYPVAEARCGLAGGGCLQEFQGGAVYWAPGRGAHAVDGDIRARWGTVGWEFGRYGYPVAEARCGLAGGGCLQEFQGGTIYWSARTGAQAVDGDIRARWGTLGWEFGRYGYPVAGARCGLAGGGCLQEFQGGAVYWSPATGAQAVDGDIRARWGQLGWEYGQLGYPVAGAVVLPNGDATQRFQRGALYWTAGTRQVRVV